MECYICYEGNGELLTGICDCKSNFVHTECLLKWVNGKQNYDCTICKTQYKCVTQKREKFAKQYFSSIIFIFIIVVIYILVCVWLLIPYGIRLVENFTVVGLFGLVFSSCAFAIQFMCVITPFISTVSSKALTFDKDELYEYALRV